MANARVARLFAATLVVGVTLAPVASTQHGQLGDLLASRGLTASATQAAEKPATVSVARTSTNAATTIVIRARADTPVGDRTRLVILTRRMDAEAGTPRTRTLVCRAGARTCVRTLRFIGDGRLRVRAAVRERGRISRLSRSRFVAWKTPAGAQAGDTPTPAAPAPTTTPGTTTAPAPGTPPPTISTPAPIPPPTPLLGLPQFTAGFDTWTRLNAQTIPPDSPQTERVGTDAHRGLKNVYVNVPRDAARTRPFPDGTIVVKAVTVSDRLALIATMRKIAGSDPTHGNWRFVEYIANSQGRFATSPGLQDGTCWGCHSTATSTDWVFTPTD
jgi:Cytochrome P460